MKVVPAICAFTALAVCACTPAESQGAVTLDTKLPVTFGQISNVVELADGRVAFADTKSKLFLSADLKSGKVDTLGTRVDTLRQAAPAEQYKFPGWVAHLAGDTVALVDFAAQRTTLWNDRGQAVAVLPIPPVAGQTPVLLYDTVGHGYKIDYQAVLGGGEPGKVVRPDSIACSASRSRPARWTPWPTCVPRNSAAPRSANRCRTRRSYSRPTISSGCCRTARRGWRADTRIGSTGVRPTASGPGERRRDYTKVPVTQADKDRVLAQVREQGKLYGMPQELKIVYPFADTKPPFDFALGRPNGEVWLQRPRAKEDAPITYDIFDRHGGWRRAAEFPAGASLAGFGKSGAIYGTIKEPNGQRTVGRFTLK